MTQQQADALDELLEAVWEDIGAGKPTEDQRRLFRTLIAMQTMGGLNALSEA